MSFACKDEYDRDTLMAYFMRPYGFLHATALVGYATDSDGRRTKCNNPFVTYDNHLLLEETSENRSKFGNHVSLSFRNKIYDACAGPVVGQSSADYAINPIDSKEGSYPHQFWNTPRNSAPRLIAPEKDDFTGQWYDARPYHPSDVHGGIMDELDRLMHAGTFRSISPDINRELEDLDFSLDITTLGQWLKDNTVNSSYKVTFEEQLSVYTGADPITKDSARQGEIV